MLERNSDLTDAEWAIVAALLPDDKAVGRIRIKCQSFSQISDNHWNLATFGENYGKRIKNRKPK